MTQIESLMKRARPLLSPEEELRIFRELDRCQDEDRVFELRTILVESNLGLIPYQIKRNPYNMVEVDDLVSEGLKVLDACVGAFDCERGFKFSNYVCIALQKRFSRLQQKGYNYATRYKSAEYEHVKFTHGGSVDPTFSEYDIGQLLDTNPAGLSAVELTIIRRKFGLGCRQETFANLARELEVSRETVRNIQFRGLRKLRQYLETRRTD